MDRCGGQGLFAVRISRVAIITENGFLGISSAQCHHLPVSDRRSVTFAQCLDSGTLYRQCCEIGAGQALLLLLDLHLYAVLKEAYLLAQDSYGVPPIPVHLADFPTVGGLVVPYITLRHRNGTAALGLVDYNRMVTCLEGKRCGVCGEVVVGRMVFLMRSFDLARNLSSEPGLCPPCAAYTMAACPMITGQMAHYRKTAPTFVRRLYGAPECQCSQWTSTPEYHLEVLLGDTG